VSGRSASRPTRFTPQERASRTHKSLDGPQSRSGCYGDTFLEPAEDRTPTTRSQLLYRLSYHGSFWKQKFWNHKTSKILIRKIETTFFNCSFISDTQRRSVEIILNGKWRDILAAAFRKAEVPLPGSHPGCVQRLISSTLRLTEILTRVERIPFQERAWS
jgi:hypothetical protein